MADLGAVLVFSIVGYIFLQSCKLSQYRWHSLEWERNLFESTLWGALFVLIARFVVSLAPKIGLGSRAGALLHSVVPAPFVGTVLSAVAIAFVLAKVFNLVVPQERAIRLAVDRYFGELFKLLRLAQDEEFLVSITTSSRKVYVGRVVSTPSLLLRDPQTRIVPVVSGFRSSERLEVEFTTAYEQIYADIDAGKHGSSGHLSDDSFGIVIPVSSIVSANRFEPDIYADYFSRTSRDRSK